MYSSNHGTRWRWVVSFTPRPLHPRYPMDRRRVRHHNLSGRGGVKKNKSQESNPGRSARSLVTILSCPGSHIAELVRNKWHLRCSAIADNVTLQDRYQTQKYSQERGTLTWGQCDWLCGHCAADVTIQCTRHLPYFPERVTYSTQGQARCNRPSSLV